VKTTAVVLFIGAPGCSCGGPAVRPQSSGRSHV
jgi:hypothetical protein